MTSTALGKASAPIAVTEALGHNKAAKPWIVQKFGGTSIGKFARQIAGNIVMQVARKLFTSGRANG